MVVFASHIQRFFNSIDKVGCWEWQGTLNEDRYGIFRLQGKRIKAHRFSFSLYKGDIPKDKVVRHNCDNAKCCNPNHLQLGTQEENIQDMIDRKRRPTSYLTKRLKLLMNTE